MAGTSLGGRSSRILRNPLLWVVGIAFMVVLVKGMLFLAFPPGWLSPVELKVEVRLEKDARTSLHGRKDDVFLQIYQNTGEGMSEEESRRIPVVASGSYEWTKIVLPSRNWEEIRFDGPSQPGLFSIRAVRLLSDQKTLEWRGEELREVLIPTVQLTEIGPDGDGGLIFRSSGGDPQFDFLINPPEPSVFGGDQLFRLLLPLGATFCALVLFGWGSIFMIRVWLEMRQEGGVLAGFRGIWVGVGLFLFVVTYLSLGAQAEKKPVPQHMAGHNLYFHLTESFLHGRLDLLEEPSRPLLELENPFDPVANETLRLHDASFFHNRYYVYFGPAPVVTLYIPWRVVTGTDLPDRWADACFLSWAFFFLFFTFLRVRSLLPTKPCGGSILVGLLTIGLTTGALFLMARSVVYEVALSSALMWMAAAVFLTFEGLRKGRSAFLLFFAGLALGFAMGSRHSFVLVSLIFVASVFLFLVLRRGYWVEGLRKILALSIPAAAIGLLLLVHNYSRFGDPLEFGHNFQIGVVDPNTVDFLEPENLAYNLTINLFQPPAIYSPFPWIHLRGQELLEWVSRPASYIRVEGGVGLLVANPYLVLLPFLCPVAFWRCPDRRALWLFAVVAVAAAINFLIIALFSYSAPRYAVDYVPWMVLLFALCWSARGKDEPVGWGRRILGWLLIPTLAWSIYVHFGLALQRIL